MSRKLLSLVRLVIIVAFVLTACSPGAAPTSAPTTAPIDTPLPSPTATRLVPTATPTEPLPTLTPIMPFPNGEYRNLFREYLGKSDAEVNARVNAAWQQFFYGNDSQRVYYPVGDDMAYIMDIGNNDVRTEGMSYGMMISVQLDKKAEFDRLWKWAKTYMYQSNGTNQGYFAWHCTSEGKQIDPNPAPDGEEWFVMALFFASGRWGNGEGIFDYQAQAQELLNTMLHKGDKTNDDRMDLFQPSVKQIDFGPGGQSATFTDPSYQLPAFYELWGRWSAQDNQFWFDATKTSRDFFKKAANPQTGLMPNYAAFDGKAFEPPWSKGNKDFRWDAFRTLSNVALDYAWFGADPWEVEQSNRVLSFFASMGVYTFPSLYSLDGKPLSSDHSTGLAAMAATAALAADPEIGKPFVQALWDTQLPYGQWRYYDGMLYILGFLQVSGNFRIHIPATTGPG